MPSHTHALRSFFRRLTWRLLFREAVRWATMWLFFWGLVVLAARSFGTHYAAWMSLGLSGALLAAALAAVRQRRRLPQRASVRAAYDHLNGCGGLLMAQEAGDMSAWEPMLPAASIPVLRWRGGRALGLIALAGLFVGVALLAPDRWTGMAGQPPLEIGNVISELQAQVDTLKQEKILEQPKADDLGKQLARLEQKSSALDPSKTWEALDHIKEANSDLAKQAAEEAAAKLASLAQADTLARALEKAADAGMSAEIAAQAARDLAGLLKGAKLEEDLLKIQLPPELASPSNGLSTEDMQKLLSSIQSGKTSLGKTVANLAGLKLIDGRMLSQCRAAGECKNGQALAAFLSQCTNAGSCSAAICAYGRGGLTRGDQPADTPMTWTDGAAEQGTRFKEQSLPPASRLSDSQTVGVSRAAPDLSGETVSVDHGALAGAQPNGGAANAQTILPRHRQAVQNFFKREQN